MFITFGILAIIKGKYVDYKILFDEARQMESLVSSRLTITNLDIIFNYHITDIYPSDLTLDFQAVPVTSSNGYLSAIFSSIYISFSELQIAPFANISECTNNVLPNYLVLCIYTRLYPQLTSQRTFFGDFNYEK